MRLRIFIGAIVVLATAGTAWYVTTRGTTIVVDASHPSARASGPGTSDEPFDTITAAVEEAQTLTAQGERVTITIAPGVYRESVTVDGSPDHAPLTIAGAGSDAVVVSGADELTAWTTVDESAAVVAHAWEEDWGVAQLPPGGWEEYFAEHDVSDVARRQEAVWVDGEVVRQVLTRDEVFGQAGTFHVDEAGDEILLHPAQPSPLGTVEVAVRDSGVVISNRANVSLRGVTIQRVATSLQRSALDISDSTDITVMDVRTVWNSWGGLGLADVRGGVIRDVAASDNGVIGLSIYRSEDLELIDVENSRNNAWRGVWARYLGWETGAKVFRARRLTFTNYRASGNAAAGLWLDTDVADVTIDGAVIAGNLRDGLFLEAIQGPVAIRDAVICGNGESGIVDGKSDGVSVEGARIFGNVDAQVLFSGEPGGRTFTTYDTDLETTVHSRGWVLRGNTVAAGDDADLVKSHLDAPDWATVTEGLTSEDNTWTAVQPYEFHAAGDAHDLDGWRALTGQDVASTFAVQPPPQDCPA